MKVTPEMERQPRNLAELNACINADYGRLAMGVLYRGIANFEADDRLVEAAREDLEQFVVRLHNLLRRNSRAA